jgi:hypothetical protein
VSLLCPVARGGEAGERPWSVGYAEADITPAPGQVQMRGFGSERYAKGTLAPLLTQVVALRDRDGHNGVLITADIAGFERVMTEAIRRAITRKHGIPAEDVMLAAAALKDLSPATIEYGSIDFRGIGCNRRLPVDGKMTWGPYLEGSFDGHTPILRIKRDQSPRQLVVIGHACHPTSSGKIEKWSPDYPGAARDYLADQLPDTKGVFIQGCGGDAKIVHKDPDTGKLVFSADPERSREAGEKLARAALVYLEGDQMIPLAGKLACSLATGHLNYGERWSKDEIEKEAYTGSKKRYYTWVARQFLALPDRTESYRYDVQIWKLGSQLTIFGMEGEVCSPWGPMLRSMTRTEQAMVIGYVNNVDAYIPDKRIVREGGYEGGEAPVP